MLLQHGDIDQLNVKVSQGALHLEADHTNDVPIPSRVPEEVLKREPLAMQEKSGRELQCLAIPKNPFQELVLGNQIGAGGFGKVWEV